VTLLEDVDPFDGQRAQYTALKAARDRVLVFVLAYTVSVLVNYSAI
jgi:hypothetical protein